MEKELQDFQLPEGPTQQLWDSLANKLETLIASNVSTCRAQKQKQKPWVTPILATLFHKRDRAFQQSKSSKTTSSRNTFLQLRHEAQQEERKAYKQYTESIFNIGKDECNPTGQNVCKRFWSFIKPRRMDSCGIPALKSEGTLVLNAQGKANILNKQYTSVFNKKDSDPAPTKGPSPHPTAPDIQISEDGVLKMLKGLNPNKACGPDKLPPTLLKNLAGVLAKPLTAIFQSSVDQGYVPEQWKKALVSPIYKKGDRHTAANYRPVSLTSVCCKLCEHAIAKSIMAHLDANNILTDSQHGFRSKRSCQTQLLTFVDELLKSLSAGGQIDLAILDFSKAFDVVPHARLLYKLEF